MATICSPLASVRVPSRNASQKPLAPLNTNHRNPLAAIPNRHIPYCSPGPQPTRASSSSPHKPSSPTSKSTLSKPTSLLYPPDKYTKLSDRSSVYLLDGRQLHAALEHQASQPLPDPGTLFPWLHGLHADNHLQLGFFAQGKKSAGRIPTTFRSITVVKAGGDLTHSKIKGAIGPTEILEPIRSCQDTIEHRFVDADPKQGFSVRNFHIQTAKLAPLSDIVVYGDARTTRGDVRQLAQQISQAQRRWRLDNMSQGVDTPTYHTFMLSEPFGQLEQLYPEIVVIDSDSHVSEHIIDLFHSERQEMHNMSAPTEIARNVWLGPTSATSVKQTHVIGFKSTLKFDFLVEAVDGAHMPHGKYLDAMNDLLDEPIEPKSTIPQLEFPGSGSLLPPSGSSSEIDGLLATCDWLYRHANGITSDNHQQDYECRRRKDSRVDSAIGLDESDARSRFSIDDFTGAPLEAVSSGNKGRTVLIHCVDGYTESSLLAIAYYMYANCVPLHTAYIDLHTQLKRNFFAYSSDLAFLAAAEPRILQSSAVNLTGPSGPFALTPPEPEWMAKCDGSLPSRITDYMYLGNLGHANNPALLSALGIGQVLSVGEPVTWTDAEAEAFSAGGSPTGGRSKLMYIDNVQDNGIDSLTDEIYKCLQFIKRGRQTGTATLVHCRVGVSRSATICIAEIMRELDYSFPRAYCYVRARRLNVIIQPHLRFAYELLKWEEELATARGRELRRDLEWATVAREIAALNRPYCRPA